MEKRDNNREVGTGKYTFTGGRDRLCVCGHPLGVHCGTRIKTARGMVQDCMNSQGAPGGDGQECHCQCFKPKK